MTAIQGNARLVVRMKRLDGKVALITGGSSGIGLATALLFAKEGAKVAIAGRSQDKGKHALNTLKIHANAEPIFIQADLSQSSAVLGMVQEVIRKFSRLDILFCNAGINIIRPIAEITEDDWNSIIANNLTSVFLCCKYALPQMESQGGGSIICNASTYSFVGHEDFSAYNASKGGVLSFAKALALEVAKHKIRVNCVCPTTTETSMARAGWERTGHPEKIREERVKLHPLGRLCTPEDVAQAVLYLASDEASFVTGSSLVVDGGYTAQ